MSSRRLNDSTGKIGSVLLGPVCCIMVFSCIKDTQQYNNGIFCQTFLYKLCLAFNIICSSPYLRRIESHDFVLKTTEPPQNCRRYENITCIYASLSMQLYFSWWERQLTLCYIPNIVATGSVLGVISANSDSPF